MEQFATTVRRSERNRDTVFLNGSTGVVPLVGAAVLVLAESEIAVSEDILVANNGFLTGSGQLQGDTFIDGTISPGESAGCISIQGSLDMSSSSKLSIELGGETAPEFDLVSVIGDAHLDGTLTVDLINGFTLVDGDQFVILETTNGTSGIFAGLS